MTTGSGWRREWHKPITSAFRMWRQEDNKYKANLSLHGVSLSLKEKKIIQQSLHVKKVHKENKLRTR
jgi:hypothetical protein